MKIVYLAGPYSAADKTGHGVLVNIRKAEAIAAYLWTFGVGVICPHKNSAFFDGLLPYSDFLAAGCEMVRRSDALILMRNWEGSAGARLEKITAEQNGIPCFVLSDETGESARDFIEEIKQSDSLISVTAREMSPLITEVCTMVHRCGIAGQGPCNGYPRFSPVPHD